jgi:hypothetical protein
MLRNSLLEHKVNLHSRLTTSARCIFIKVLVRVPAGAVNFPLHHHVQASSGAHPVSYIMGTRGSFPGVRRSGREADQSSTSSVEFENAWSCTCTPPIRLTGVVLKLKHKDNFTCTLYFNDVHFRTSFLM